MHRFRSVSNTRQQCIVPSEAVATPASMRASAFTGGRGDGNMCALERRGNLVPIRIRASVFSGAKREFFCEAFFAPWRLHSSATTQLAFADLQLQYYQAAQVRMSDRAVMNPMDRSSVLTCPAETVVRCPFSGLSPALLPPTSSGKVEVGRQQHCSALLLLFTLMPPTVMRQHASQACSVIVLSQLLFLRCISFGCFVLLPSLIYICHSLIRVPAGMFWRAVLSPTAVSAR